MIRWIIFLIACSTGAFLNAAPLTVIVGVSPANPPLSSLADDKNHFYGFEIDIMDELCNRTGIVCQYQSVIVSEIYNKLMSGDISFAIAAVIFSTGQEKGIIFSLPYLQSGGQFMTLNGSGITTLDDIRNKKVGVRRGTLGGGTIFKDLILKMYNQQIKIKEYPTMEALLSGLSSHDVQVIFSNEAALKFWYYNNKSLYHLIGKKIPIGDGYAILSTKKYVNIIQQMNRELLDMMRDGTYLKIYNRYFLSIPP